jgi:hypothetical protein
MILNSKTCYIMQYLFILLVFEVIVVFTTYSIAFYYHNLKVLETINLIGNILGIQGFFFAIIFLIISNMKTIKLHNSIQELHSVISS